MMIKRTGFLLWVALLAFGLPEVFAGSGANWIIRLDFYLLGIPLYALHFLLLVQLAIKTRRTSWPALYLFGVIFGLYESWITKVIWSGYPGSDGFASGGFGQWFGIHETIGLVFFYHPVVSFLLPLAVLCHLFPAWARMFPQPDWIFGKTRWALMRRIGFVTLIGFVSGRNMPDIHVYLLTWVPFIVLIFLGYLVLRRHANGPIASPVLSVWSIVFLTLWLSLIYAVTYFNLQIQYLPPVYIQWITLGFYPLLLGAILHTVKVTDSADQLPFQPSASMPAKWLLILFAAGLISVAMGPVTPFVMVSLFFLTMILIGAILFIWLALWRGVWRKGIPDAS